MSMKSWTEEGYGYKLYNNNLDKIKSFIVNSNRYSEKKKEIMEAEDELDLEIVINNPVPWEVADIINDQENTQVFQGYQECGDTDQEAMLGIAPQYPWADFHMTKEKADELLKKYADILGIEEEAEYFEAEYFG